MGLTKHQKKFLNELVKIKSPKTFTIVKKAIVINPGVFPPTTDSILMVKNLKRLKNKYILDITSGSGIFSVVAGLKGATGIACDINPKAIKNIKENFTKFKTPFKIIKSNLFSKVPKQKFDIILANGPFSEGKPKNFLEYAMLGMKKFTNNLFQNANKFLKPEGKILIVFTRWGNTTWFERTIKKYGFDYKIIDNLFSKDKKREYLLYSVTLK
jgi:HemK-related putative methylase